MSNSFKNIKDRFNSSTKWGNVAQDPDVLKEEAAKKALNDAAVNKNAAAVAAATGNSIEDPKEVEAENEEMLDADYEVPNLKLRKDIYGHFPVVLRSIPVGPDHVERFAIEWDRRNFYAMKSRDATSTECYNDFGYYSVWRMIYALRKRSDQYTVEPPRSKSEVCVLAMRAAPPSESMIRSTRMFMLTRGVHIPPEPPEPAEARENNAVLGFSMKRQAALLEAAKKPKAPLSSAPPPPSSASPPPPSSAVAAAPPPPRTVAPPTPAGTVHTPTPAGGAGGPPSHSHKAPLLRTLKDIMAHFPIVYKHDTTRNLYLLDVFGKKLKEDAERRAGRPLSRDELSAERRRVEHALHEALLASDAWNYYEPKGANKDHFAVLAMKHAYRG